MAFVAAFAALAVFALIHELVRRRCARRWRDRIAIAAACGAHYAAIAVVAFTGFVALGLPTGRNVWSVRDVAPGLPAARVLAAGDRLVRIDGNDLGHDSPAARINAAGGRPVVITIERDGQLRDVTVQPSFDQQSQRWRVGIRPGFEPELVRAAGPAAGAAVTAPVAGLVAAVSELRVMLMGSDVAEPGGPKRIIEEYPLPAAPWRDAFGAVLNAAFIALLVQAGLDMWRAKKRPRHL